MVSSQNHRPKRRVAPLGAACTGCGHSRNWHRYDDDTCSQCNCRQFTSAPGGKGGAA
ncbi:hypothetical protein KEF29_03630 [Streptomyces tuirus]|uniref:Uncharacterized protein n=1 Tax=Streptomyces tuirus TaxID=68278 RepID=A0A941FEX3_9ACTN|nr:hypothetical protein [Streptomyces tuirus]